MTAWSGDKISTEMTEYFFFLSACIGLSVIGLWWLDH